MSGPGEHGTTVPGEFNAGPPPAARAESLTKTYGEGAARVVALDSIDVTLPSGRLTAIMGPSGSGKSTLMHCLAGLDKPTTGRVLLGDTDLSTLDDTRLTKLRRERVGFIFQAFNLVSTLTAIENVVLPFTIARNKPDQRFLTTLLDTLGLQDRLGHRPSELSGGQQQRVAVARALATRPTIVFADEPTGNLDSRSSTEILEYLRRSVEELRQTIVLVTHDPRAAAYADSVLFLSDGRVVDEMARPTADRVLERMKNLDELVGPGGVSHVAHRRP